MVIKEIKGSQYGVQLESAVRDRLAAIDKYEEEEEEALEKVTEFFQKKYFKKDSLITFHFPAASRTAEVNIRSGYTYITLLKAEERRRRRKRNQAETDMFGFYLCRYPLRRRERRKPRRRWRIQTWLR